MVQVWTLPGLEPIKVFSLSSCLGFPWSWQAEPSLLANLHHMCALAPDGHMALVGPCNEVVTLGVLRGLRAPAPLRGLYDRDLSEASLAAAQAIADLQEKREPWSGVVPHDTAASGGNNTDLRKCDTIVQHASGPNTQHACVWECTVLLQGIAEAADIVSITEQAEFANSYDVNLEMLYQPCLICILTQRHAQIQVAAARSCWYISMVTLHE